MLSFIVAGLWNLSGPPPWWDEGWTLSVARNWVERGHYGRLLDGQIAPNGLEASFWVTAPVRIPRRLSRVSRTIDAEATAGSDSGASGTSRAR